MGARIRRRIAESKSEQRIKGFVLSKLTEVHQAVKDAGLYYSGATEQLLLQQGQAMTVQAGMLEWLDKHLGKPGFVPSDQIKAICEENIARMKAEREAREAEAKKRAEEEAVKPRPALTSVPDESIEDFVAAEAARATFGDPAAPPDFGDKPYDPTAAANIAAHAEALRNRTGCYAPGASDDPDRVIPADIVPASPDAAPADTTGSA